MIISIVFCLYCILLFFAIYNTINQYIIKKKINAFICFQAAFILYYLIIPIVSQIVITYYPNHLTGYLSRLSLIEPHDLIYGFIYTLITYIIILVIYQYKPVTNLSINKLKDYQNRHNMDKIKVRLECFYERKVFWIALTTGVITLMIAIISETIVANSLGGILNAVTMGDKLRAFGSEKSKYLPQNLLFLNVLMVCSLASTYFIFFAYRIYKRFSIRLLLIISMFTSVFFLLINAGRIAVLLFALSFFIDFSFRKTKKPFIFMMLFSAIILLTLELLDNLFFYLSYDLVKESSSTLGFSIINEFLFPYVNILNVNNINEMYGLRWGIDYFSWIINIIPTSILENFGLTKMTKGYQFITEYYKGANASSGTPTDIITLGIRQFGIIGIFITGGIVSLTCKYLDKLIDITYSDKFIFMTTRISLIMFIIVPYADIDSFVRGSYDMILVLIFVVMVDKVKIKTLKRFKNIN